MKQLKTEYATSVPPLLSRAAFVVFLFWLLTAVVLRVYGLAQQWLIDDEWHGIHRILAGEPWRDMFFAVGVADFSVPQTLYYRVLARFTEVDEVLMRLPVVIAGLGLVAGGAQAAVYHDVVFQKNLPPFRMPDDDHAHTNINKHGRGNFTGERALCFPGNILRTQENITALQGLGNTSQGSEGRSQHNSLLKNSPVRA
jgi:hypothetical protein